MLLSVVEFQDTVPHGPVIAVQGQQVLLPCSFLVSGSLGSLVVIWHRGQEVVHSFYHGRDQLDRQSRRYANRSSLMYSDIERGDSSLRLELSNMEDEGDYTCSVSTLLGSQRKTLSLKVAGNHTCDDSKPLLKICIVIDGIMVNCQLL